MAQIPVPTPAGEAQAYMSQTYSQAVDGNNNPTDGTYVHGGADTDVARQLSEGLIKTPFDDTVTVGGFSGAYINAMSRELGSRQVKAMRYGYYSIGLRKVCDAVKSDAATVTLEAKHIARGAAVTRVEISVEDASVFDVTDVITFEGIQGYSFDKDENGNFIPLPMVDLTARVAKVNSGTNKLEIQVLNGVVGSKIVAGTTIYILGHAANEADASTTPYCAFPERKEQYQQKFIVQSLVSRVEEESIKEAKWGIAENDDLLMKQMLEDIEKSYIKGVKSYTFDKETQKWTYTTSGVIEQIVSGGGAVITINKKDMTKEKILDIMTEVFIGNNGSETRYMLTGINFAKAFFSMKDVKDFYDTNSTERKFEYDWTRLRMFNYIIKNAPDSLFDKIGMRDYALVIDRQHLERRFFFSVDETQLALKETGAYDGKSTVWSEISSVVLKYPSCHALIKLVDDESSSAA